jgi:flagellar P-ring protein precursor FlgI
VTWLFALLLALSPAAEAARVKDVASLYGVRENALVGYGLVVGLNRSGDSQQNAAAIRALANRLQGLGMTMSDNDIKARNVAVVMVTSSLPSGARPGSRLDVQVSSAGDARSLEGGVLLLTPLYAANGMALASSQGALVVGGYTVTSGGDTTTKNHPTVGTIPRGATVEVDPPNGLNFAEAVSFDWVLQDPDFTSASRMVAAMNGALGGEYSSVVDGGTVRVQVPDAWLGRQPEMVALLETLPVKLDQAARVVVNERTGTVVMGADISVSPVAIAHGNLTIEVDRVTAVSQPGALSGGQTAAVANTSVKVDEKAGRIEMVEGVTVGDVVSALNKMGITPRDMIVILQAMQAAGGLQAQIETL